MKAIIPVAGLGTRLRPHTYTTPKVLLEVAGKPILAHILDELVELDVDEVTFIVSYLGDEIEKWIKENYKLQANFVEQKELLGLGHAIYMAKPYHENSDAVLIILGDTIFDAKLAPVLKWKENGLGVKSVDNPHRFGIVELEGDKVTNLVEKPSDPPTNLAIVGIYNITQPSFLFQSLEEIMNENIKTKGEFQLTDALKRMMDKDCAFRSFEIDGWFDCGKPETVIQTNRDLLSYHFSDDKLNALQKKYPDCVIHPPVYVHESAELKNSIIGPNSTICRDVTIHNSIVRDSIINAGAEIEGKLLEKSLIGKETKVKGIFDRLDIGDSSSAGETI